SGGGAGQNLGWNTSVLRQQGSGTVTLLLYFCHGAFAVADLGLQFLDGIVKPHVHVCKSFSSSFYQCVYLFICVLVILLCGESVTLIMLLDSVTLIVLI
ncbi:MAG: hypothetical protein AN484_27545, partial [Aphanizomenon flos-aquae WA102]